MKESTNNWSSMQSHGELTLQSVLTPTVPAIAGDRVSNVVRWTLCSPNRKMVAHRSQKIMALLKSVVQVQLAIRTIQSSVTSCSSSRFFIFAKLLVSFKEFFNPSGGAERYCFCNIVWECWKDTISGSNC